MIHGPLSEVIEVQHLRLDHVIVNQYKFAGIKPFINIIIRTNYHLCPNLPLNNSKMGRRKYKPTAREAVSGDIVILSTTTRYTSRGLVKKSVLCTDSNIQPSPSKTPKSSFTTRQAHNSRKDIDFDSVLVEPLQLPKSKVRNFYFLDTVP